MRLRAYTLIEGVVSMVILSILMSVAVLISFHLYQSFPSRREIALQNMAEMELDSLIRLKTVEEQSYIVKELNMAYSSSRFGDFEFVRLGSCTLFDSIGGEFTASKIFFVANPESNEE